MTELKIDRWVSYDEAADLPEAGDEHERLLYDEIKRLGLKFTGTRYQQKCVPVFSDGTALLCTMRYWGEVMAENWGSNYVDWAWVHPREHAEVLPPGVEGGPYG